MNIEMPNFASALPEIFVLSMACIILVIDLFLTDRSRVVTYVLTQLTLVVAIVLTVMHSGEKSIVSFGGTFVRDTIGCFPVFP